MSNDYLIAFFRPELNFYSLLGYGFLLTILGLCLVYFRKTWGCNALGHSWRCSGGFTSCCKWCGIDYTSYYRSLLKAEQQKIDKENRKCVIAEKSFAKENRKVIE